MKQASNPAPQDAPFLPSISELRVSYAEVDKMGVVYYGNYLRWFEIGRADFMRARGRSYRQLEEEDGLILPVVSAYARYRQSACYDDLLQVHTAPLEIGPARVKFGYQVLRPSDGALLADGYTEHCCLGPSRRVRRLPPQLVELLKRPPL